MFNFVQRRRYYFLFSGTVVGLAIALMVYSTLTTGAAFSLSIDFVGGSIYELAFESEGATEANIREVFTRYGDENVTIQALGDPSEYRWSIRGGFRDQQIVDQILRDLDALAPLDEGRLLIETVSETVGAEVTRAAIIAILFASAVVASFIILAFRRVPRASRYGLCAISAMVHDVFVMLGFASLMGLLFGWEIDALFLTAVLTVAGFSVQDTIVIFDRIRENIPRHLGESYETIVNRSVWETVHRSLATQLNAFFIMFAILVFGGDTLRQFVVTLLVGLLSGTYSSIFIAAPLLVAWQMGDIPFLNRPGGEEGESDLRKAGSEA